MKNNMKLKLIIIVMVLSPSLILGQLNLGSIENFALFTSTGALGNTGTSNITGHVGSDVGAVSGFGAPTILIGNEYNSDAVTAQAKTDLFIAYNQLILIPATNTTHGVGFGSETLTTGVYTVAGATTLTGALTLDGLGDSNAVFVFRFGGAYSTGISSSIVLTNGARPCNIFWVTQGAISLGESTIMKGTLIANNAAVSAAQFCDVEGRMLSTTGAIAFDAGDIYLPNCANNLVLAPPGPCCNPDFGATIDFVVFSSDGAVSNVGASYLTTNIGTNFGGFTGLGTATVIGTIHDADSVTEQTKIDLFSLYSQLILNPVTDNSHSATFGGGETLTTGVYYIGQAALLAGDLTLDAEGDTNAVFIFKIRGALAISDSTNIILDNLAMSCSVFWVSEGAISIGVGSVIKGTYLANNAAISMYTGADLMGRLLSTSGAIDIHNVTADNTDPCQQPNFIPLPIELLSFDAECENQNITIAWSTASEINNDFFTIERSIDGMNWEIITTVSGAGNSNSMMYYTIIDITNRSEIAYYRLKQTDFDGSFKYSSIITAKNCDQDFTELAIYPNPANNYLNISLKYPEEKIVSVSIYNLIGKLIYYSETYQPHIVFEEKLNGIHILQIELDSKIIVEKFVIIN
jgi:hypothetical protein